ncbi:MAG TPA: transglutaminase-like domain-containing protein [Thermoanaerobaculia bacterium]|nr:transglutaminase-like domain-containing protein [Thermoanaerobaculia bacterium]
MPSFISFSLLLVTVSALAVPPASRAVDTTLVARLSEIPPGTTAVAVWVPLPRETSAQTIQDLEIDSPFAWQRRTEREFGNQYLFARIDSPRSGMELLRLRFRAMRREITFDGITPTALSAAERQRNIRAERLMTISPRVHRLAEAITRDATGTLAQARAIYAYVLATMKYDKTMPGWGRGDTERACDIRAGNCTDFHSLFISLARAKRIPARFIIGFPVTNGSIPTTGYHCWAEFYLPGTGWVPVDPSEASKSDDPLRRAYLFGNLDADRIEFTRGRDLRVSPPTRQPLNFFIYPYIEANGEELESAAVTLSYRVLEAPFGGQVSGSLR